MADQIIGYHSTLPDERRTTNEADLRDGPIRGVWSTNALELGIDIGSLDVVLWTAAGNEHEHVPACRSCWTWSESESRSPSCKSDPLDQYCMANPERLFDGDPEQAAVNPANRQILNDHVYCAVQELFL